MKPVLLLAIGIYLELCSFSLAVPSRPNIRSASDVDSTEIVTYTTTPTASGPAIGTPTSTLELAQNTIVSSSPSSTVKSASESSSAMNTGLSSGAVLGLTVGASMVIVATLMSFVLWCFCIRRHRRASSQHQLLDISSPGLPQQPYKPTRTNSDLSQWTATSSSPLHPSDPRLRPLRLPDVAFPRNKNLPPSPVEMAGDIYKGQVAQHVTEVAAVITPVEANYPPQLGGTDDGQNHHDAKVFEAGGREIITREKRVPESTTPIERTNLGATSLSREEATRRAKELEDTYKEVKMNSPKTISSPVPNPTVLYDHKASPPRRIIISSSPYRQSLDVEPTPSFSSPYQQHHQQHLSHTEPAIPTTTNTTSSSSSPHPPQTLTTPNTQAPTTPSPLIPESTQLNQPSKSSKPKYSHISSLDGRIRHVDGVVEFKRMTVKEWRRERGRDRMLDPKKGKERRVLGI